MRDVYDLIENCQIDSPEGGVPDRDDWSNCLLLSPDSWLCGICLIQVRGIFIALFTKLACLAVIPVAPRNRVNTKNNSGNTQPETSDIMFSETGVAGVLWLAKIRRIWQPSDCGWPSWQFIKFEQQLKRLQSWVLALFALFVSWLWAGEHQVAGGLSQSHDQAHTQSETVTLWRRRWR